MSEGYTPFPEEKLPADLPTIIIYGVDKSLYIPKRHEPELKRVIPEKKIPMPPTEQKLAPKSIYISTVPSIEITPELERVIPEKKMQMPPSERELAPRSIYIPAPPSIEITPEKEKGKFPWFLVIASIVILFILLKEA